MWLLIHYLLLRGKLILNLAARHSICYLHFCSLGVWAWLSGFWMSSEAATKVSAEGTVSSEGPTVEESTSRLTACLLAGLAPSQTVGPRLLWILCHMCFPLDPS